MKIVGYTRVSSTEQGLHGHSLEAQATKIRAYAAAFGLDLVGVVEDSAQSGKSLRRPGIQRVLAMLESGEVAGVLVAKVDRLSRSVVDVDTLVRSYFSENAKHPAALLAVDNHIDTATAAGRMLLNVLMSINQGERELIAERTRAALQHLKESGVKLGPPAIEKDAEGQAVVARIQALKAQGLPLRGIAAALEAEGIRPRRADHWSPAALAKIIARTAPQKEAA